MKTYNIGGKEICGFPERSYGNVDITLLEERFNQLLEALDEKKEEPKSTLREKAENLIFQGGGEKSSKFIADKIISLFKDTLLGEARNKIRTVRINGEKEAVVTLEDVEQIIQNL